jgi:prevent-host-death family protein
MLTTHERIITSQKLAEQVDIALANAQQEPLIVTESGSPKAYLISVELFDKLVAHLETMSDEEVKIAVTISEKQFEQGAYKTLEEAEAILEAAWKELES